MKKYYYVFKDGEVLLKRLSENKYAVPYQENPPTNTDESTNILDVTSSDGTVVRAYCIDNITPTESNYEFCGLRQSFYKLTPTEYQTAGKCEELLYWDKTTRYCGVCGTPLKMNTDISKLCPNCGREVWPQLSIAIIVLIHRGNEVLLVRAKNFTRPFFGLVAGFVETGESLEEAVVREVHEETGLKIRDIKYFASQPWPYPCGLMVGFNAEYQSGEIKLQTSELLAGEWFDKDNLPQIPEKLSIARQLIDNWLETETR